jgi:hypothetical protein
MLRVFYVLAELVVQIMVFIVVTLYFCRRLVMLRSKIMLLFSGSNPECYSETHVLVCKISELNPDAGDSIFLGKFGVRLQDYTVSQPKNTKVGI